MAHAVLRLPRIVDDAPRAAAARPRATTIVKLLAAPDFEAAVPRLLLVLGEGPLPDELLQLPLDHESSRDHDALCAKLLELLERRVRGAATEDARVRFLRDLSMLRDQVVLAHEPWVRAIAREYRSYRLPLGDLVQEASIALLRAIEKFDWRRNVKFRTYAEYWIRQAIERELARSRSLVHVPLYVQQRARRLRREGRLDKRSVLAAASELGVPANAVMPVLRFGNALVSIDEESESGVRLVDQLMVEVNETMSAEEYAALLRRLEEVLSRLPRREGEAVRRRFGLLGQPRQTLAEIGAVLHVTPERVRQIVTRALERLRQGPSAAVLASFLD